MKNNPDIIWLDVAESSNDEARKAIDSLDNLSVVAVRCQTSGRGQGTNSWESAPGENLTFSIVLKDLNILPKEQIVISQITALSVVELLEKHGIEAKIKLPNDIYVGSKKICGILIENTLCSNKIRWSIIGIGINVNQTVFPTHLPNPTSILLETGIHGPGMCRKINPEKGLGLDLSQEQSQQQNSNPCLDLNQLLIEFHEIYSQYYHNHIIRNNYLDDNSKSRLEALDQLFRSKLICCKA